ncbi:hypothetical protein [Spongiactinospora sp. 9N601]|uniref:hypothetical protein n=1 Tax=Spongiactinospora sp. 9N601 TaxID=3375149 RepID=UPI0037A2A4B5
MTRRALRTATLEPADRLGRERDPLRDIADAADAADAADIAEADKAAIAHSPRCSTTYPSRSKSA